MGRTLAVYVFVGLLLAPQHAHADILAPFVLSLSESAVVLLPAIVIVEALILWRSGRVGLLRAGWLALVVNLASTAVGAVLGLVAMPFPAVLIDLALVPLFLAATVGIEGGLLRWLARDVPRPYRLSLRLNVASYIILIAGAAYIMNQQAIARREQRDRAFLRRATAPEAARAPAPVPVPDGAAL